MRQKTKVLWSRKCFVTCLEWVWALPCWYRKFSAAGSLTQHRVEWLVQWIDYSALMPVPQPCSISWQVTSAGQLLMPITSHIIMLLPSHGCVTVLWHPHIALLVFKSFLWCHYVSFKWKTAFIWKRTFCPSQHDPSLSCSIFDGWEIWAPKAGHHVRHLLWMFVSCLLSQICMCISLWHVPLDHDMCISTVTCVSQLWHVRLNCDRCISLNCDNY